MVVTVTPFAGESLPSLIEERAFAEIGRLLAATAVDVTVEKYRRE
jgi:hypothetical protein